MSDEQGINDPQAIKKQYKTDKNLNIRIRTHQLYGTGKGDFVGWVLDHIAWQGDEVVIDVGCGAGIYVDGVRERCRHYIAADLSLGMLQNLPPYQKDRLNLNAQQLPLPDNHFDVLLANHMIYHIPDKPKAIAEFRRILKPNGKLLVSTNSHTSMSELFTLTRTTLTELGLDLQHNNIFINELDFHLEDGAGFLQPHFSKVTRFDSHGALVFPDPQPVIDYIGSSRERWATMLASVGKTWQDVESQLRQTLTTHIAQHGEFRVNKLTGIFVCS